MESSVDVLGRSAAVKTGWRWSREAYWRLAVALMFVAAFVPTGLRLAAGPWQSEQEGHGPFILVGVAWMVWRRRAVLAKAGAPALGWGVALVVAGLAVMAVMRSQDLLVVEAAAVVPVALGCVLLIGGWRLARAWWFPIAFLVFAAPPPGWAFDAMTVPLKVWVADVVAATLANVGFPIAQDGVVIFVGPYRMFVEDACSGMNSILALSAIGVFYLHELVPPSLGRRLALTIAILPVAVFANLLRVGGLVVAAYALGPDVEQLYFHDSMGIVLFVLALGLFLGFDALARSVQCLALRGGRAVSEEAKL